MSIPPHKSIQTVKKDIADTARAIPFLEVIDKSENKKETARDEFFRLRKLAVSQGKFKVGDKLADLKLKLKEVS